MCIGLICIYIGLITGQLKWLAYHEGKDNWKNCPQLSIKDTPTALPSLLTLTFDLEFHSWVSYGRDKNPNS